MHTICMGGGGELYTEDYSKPRISGLRSFVRVRRGSDLTDDGLFQTIFIS